MTTEKNREIIIPKWLAREKGVGPRIKKYAEINETDKAIEIDTGHGRYWLPKSQITYNESGG